MSHSSSGNNYYIAPSKPKSMETPNGVNSPISRGDNSTPGSSITTGVTTSAVPFPHHHYPFHHLPSDCIHVILHYHIFHFKIIPKYREKNTGENADHEYLGLQNVVKDVGASVPFAAPDQVTFITKYSPEWNFLQKYAHSVECRRETTTGCEDDPNHLPINWFLNNCRHRKHKEAFYYLELSDEDVNLMPELLRCVPKLDLTMNYSCSNLMLAGMPDSPQSIRMAAIVENLRGIESLDLEFLYSSIETSCFRSLRGVKELNISTYNEEDPQRIQEVFENFRGLESLTLTSCDFPCLDSLLINFRGIRRLSLCSMRKGEGPQVVTDSMVEQLRGIEELRIKYMCLEQLTDRAFKNLRGIRKLVVSGSGYDNAITDAAFVNVRGIESLTLVRFTGLTNAIFEQLRGIKEFSIKACPNIQFTADALRNLRGINSLSWVVEMGSSIYLSDECLKQLSSLEKLNVAGGSIPSDAEAFRHLKHMTDLRLRGCNKSHPALSATLTDASFSHLKSVQRMDLCHLKIEVQDFRRLFREHMPSLLRFRMFGCHVRKSAIESVLQQEGFTRVWYKDLESPKGWVVGNFWYFHR